ncbi:MAG: hypothetical protein R3E09_18620 [Novosphingobium sp.]|nr:hypothetical protein [Novosphingobium sp.]
MLLVAIWAFAEATVFFIVADVPISAIGLAGGLRASARAALIATLSAALGGLVVLGWTGHFPNFYRALLAQLPGISPALIDSTASDYATHGWTAMLTGAFGGTPYKLYAAAAAGQVTNAFAFFVASLAARLPRFLLVAALSSWLGKHLRTRISRTILAGLFLGFWLLFYIAYFAAMGI